MEAPTRRSRQRRQRRCRAAAARAELLSEQGPRALRRRARGARADAADPIGSLIDDGVDVLVLPDMAIAPGATREKLDAFLEKGGVLVRFAGSRLAGSQDDLTPCNCGGGSRARQRAVGETPKKLGAFEDRTPFGDYARRMKSRSRVRFSRNRNPDLRRAPGRSLPIIRRSSRPSGAAGLLVLFHITADTTWSNLPISGLFPDMLRKIVALAGDTARAAPNEEDTAVDAPQKVATLAPNRTLDGFGAFGAPPVSARAIATNFHGPASSDHPPVSMGPPTASWRSTRSNRMRKSSPPIFPASPGRSRSSRPRRSICARR